MKFCSQCGGALVRKVPNDDDRQRFVCEACGIIHYQNPKIVTGCLVLQGDRVLLCKRAIEPRHGFWTVPAGFMELNETAQQGAQRETWEEARARVEILGPYSMINLPHVNQIYMIFRARLLNPDFRPGPESLEVGLFEERDIPWDELAFHTVRNTLRFYFEDRARGAFPFRAGTILADDGRFRYQAEPDDQLVVNAGTIRHG
jgi:ADP-ribose pyrophosphatase YjhB (NUDIX family)